MALQEITVSLPDEADLGPAMRALNPRQRAFVYYMMTSIDGNQTNAAIKAGYKSTQHDSCNAAAVQGSMLMHNPKVLAGIKEASQGMLSSLLIDASQAIADALKPGQKMSDRMKAAAMVYNRNGMHESTEVITTKGGALTFKEQIKVFRQLAEQLGVDPKKLLGDKGVPQSYIDAEFTEVVAAGPAGDLSDVL